MTNKWELFLLKGRLRRIVGFLAGVIFFYILILGVAFYFFLQSMKPRPYLKEINVPGTAFHIIDKEDCESNAKVINDRSFYQFCDIYKRPRDAMGRYNINGVDLHVPVDMFRLPNSIKSGKNENLEVYVKYPSMESPFSDMKFNDSVIPIIIKDNNENIQCLKNLACVKHGQFGQESPSAELSKNPIFYRAHRMYFITYDAEMQVDHYRDMFGKDYYIQGDPLAPSYLLECLNIKSMLKLPFNFPFLNLDPTCSSKIFIDNKVIVEYRFYQDELLEDHWKIYQAVSRLIRSFREGKSYDQYYQ